MTHRWPSGRPRRVQRNSTDRGRAQWSSADPESLSLWAGLVTVVLVSLVAGYVQLGGSGLVSGSTSDEAVLARRNAGQARGADSGQGRDGEINEDVQSAVRSVEQYWTARFAAERRRFRPVQRVYGYSVGDGSTCGGQPNTPRNAAYCFADDTIALDRQWLADSYDTLGDAFAYYLIGHEYAHAVQRRRGIAFDVTIQYELQADCFAGAFIGDQMRTGALVLEDGDLEELNAGLRSVGDPEGTPWFDPRAHGSAAQRVAAFQRGFESSLEGCP
jgi:predicted metalloprotease